MQDDSVVRAGNLPPDQAGQMVGFTREQAGWEWMSFAVTRLLPGQRLEPGSRDEDCLLYTSDAADEGLGVDLGGRRIIKKIFFSSRRRHTRLAAVSWARRCV